MTNTAGSEVVTISGLSHSREKGGARFTLLVPSFSVATAEVVGIVGPSGCGKSTLLDILGLVLRPDDCGSFAFKSSPDTPPLDLNFSSERARCRLRRRHLGYVLQAGGLLPFLSVRANIALPHQLASLRRRRHAVSEVATTLGIDDQLGKKPAHLSGGQRQRVAIARAIVHQPALLLADEPTAAVDHETATLVATEFKAIAEERGTAVAVVSHDVDLVRKIADRLYSFKLRRADPSTVESTCIELDD